MTVDVAASTPVTPAMARSFIDQARGQGYGHGIVGVRGRPQATKAVAFVDSGQPVRIAPAASALAVREVVRGADPAGWLVVVSDRSDTDLGAGLLARFVWQRLRHPDPWQAVRQRFGAHSIDGRLLRLDHAREVAGGLLELAPDGGWPPAPAGVLTRDHALGCVARAELGLPEGPLDLIGVLQWSTAPGLPARLARLRSRGGDHTVDAVLGWLADAAGEAGPLVAALLRAGTPTDLVPLGVVLDCLLAAPERHEAAVALARLEHRWGATVQGVPAGALAAAGRLSGVVVSGLLGGRATVTDARRLLGRADDLLTEAQAQPLAGGSRLLRSGLTQRLRRLAAALEAAAGAPGADPDGLAAAWRAVADHELAADDPRVAAAQAGVRLVRWLAEPDAAASGTLSGLAERHLRVDAWVDSAVNDADTGVDDHPLAAALERVLQAVQARRDAHDREFAAALSREGGEERAGGVLAVERVLPEVVLPLAREYPTLLLVLDGLSAGVATEVLADAASSVDYDLVERLVRGASQRTPALAVLPSLTEASRASLLSGRLVTGQQDAERRAFADWARAHGLGEAKLFHKKGLDTTRPGFAQADDVRQAIDDTAGQPLVGCVLNTIDDALDRTDPGGTDWSAETVKHLAPLLRAARASGRLVILTSDHGHVIERRRGAQRGPGLSGRHRAASETVGDDEVLVSGPRVLTPGNRCVLAVNERLRYGPLKAGYHGGGSPAEVIVPVVLLTPSTLQTTLEPAPVAEPAWWEPAVVGAPSAEVGVEVVASTPDVPQPDLFTGQPAPEASGPGTALVDNRTYRDQRRLVGRLAVTDESVARLVDALAATVDRRLPASRVATLLGVPLTRVPLVMSQVAKLLNIEGYPVIATDPATQAVTLDAALLAEQYGVRL